MSKKREDKPPAGGVSWNQALVVGGLAMSIPGLLFAPAAVGYWLDTLFGTSPWITAGGFVVGLVGTALNIFQLLKRVGLME